LACYIVWPVTGNLKREHDITGNRKLLSIDFHIGPVRDVKDLLLRTLELRHVRIVDESLSGHCHLVNTCATNLRVVNRANGLSFSDCPNELRKEFWDAYSLDPWMDSFDGFLCEYSIALCEIYMAFGKPLVLVAPTRYEVGRHGKDAWERLNENLRAIAHNSDNTLAANNLFDLEYLRHFTGISNIKLLPSQCLYVDAKYQPSKKEFLIGPSRLSKGAEAILNGDKGLFRFLADFRGSKDVPSFVPIRKLYTKYEFLDLAQHQGILIMPYQVSIMSLFEYYAMNIPMFVPTLDLLVRWQIEYQIMDELSWNCVLSSCNKTSLIPAHPSSPHKVDPNNVLDPAALRYWLKFADFYQWPGIIYFHNWNDLVSKAMTTDLKQVSAVMRKHKVKEMRKTLKLWETVMRPILRRKKQPSPIKLTSSTDRGHWEALVMANYPTLPAETVSSFC